MEQQRDGHDEPMHVPATARDMGGPGGEDPTADDYDHLGHQEQEQLPGGTRGGGNPDSQLGR